MRSAVKTGGQSNRITDRKWENRLEKIKKLAGISAFIVMLTAFSGCGSKPEEAQQPESAVVAMQEEIPEQDGRKAENPKEEAQQTEADSGLEEEKAAPEEPPKETVTSKEAETAGKTDQESGGEEISGEIKSLGEGGFVIGKYYTESLDNGGELIVSSSDGSDPEVKVTCTENAVYTVTYILSADGSDYRQEEGTAADLEVGRDVGLQGSWDGDTFLAHRITVTVNTTLQ